MSDVAKGQTNRINGVSLTDGLTLDFNILKDAL